MKPSLLTVADRRALREELIEERDRVARQLAALVRTFDELVDAADLEPPDDEHDPDGTTAYERAQVSSLAKASRTQLDELERALAGIDDEGYGVCERCGRPVGVERLHAVPGTRRCVRCAAAAAT